MQIYQISINGQMACFQQKASIKSQIVYREYPSDEVINKFIEACCESENPFANLDKKTIEVKVLELELI